MGNAGAKSVGALPTTAPPSPPGVETTPISPLVAPGAASPPALDVSACPVLSKQGGSFAASSSSSSSSNSPYKNPNVYNVYGEKINGPAAAAGGGGGGGGNPLAALTNREVLDPRNNMPVEANQMPCPGQRRPLPTDRVQSNIPKGGTDSTWLFPSPQMVFNALNRKGKGGDIVEEDMEGFIHAHNTMNEATWRSVMDWERLHTECGAPTLLKFQGKPHDLSPLAWMRQALGGASPFDRHDWTIDRCGTEVRYVIDFYFYDDKAGTRDAFEIVTRPALDSFEAALDRVKMNIYLKFAQWGLPCPITGHSSQSASGGASAAASRTEAAAGQQ